MDEIEQFAKDPIQQMSETTTALLEEDYGTAKRKAKVLLSRMIHDQAPKQFQDNVRASAAPPTLSDYVKGEDCPVCGCNRGRFKGSRTLRQAADASPNPCPACWAWKEAEGRAFRKEAEKRQNPTPASAVWKEE